MNEYTDALMDEQLDGLAGTRFLLNGSTMKDRSDDPSHDEHDALP